MMERARKAAEKKENLDKNSDDLLDCNQHKPKWMGVAVWNELCMNHWIGAKWNIVSTAYRANRYTQKGGICKSA